MDNETQITHFCYNTDPVLWENHRKTFPDAKMHVTNDGRVLDVGERGHAIARFGSRIEAMTVLTKAGWKFKTIPVLCAN